MTTTTNKIIEAGKKLAAMHPTAKALKNARKWWIDGKDESSAERILIDLESATLVERQEVYGFYAGNECPIHGTPHRKMYTFGSTMTAETDVCTFQGCQCAVSISHDPCGTYPSVAKWNSSYANASGHGKLNAKLWAAKFRD